MSAQSTDALYEAAVASLKKTFEFNVDDGAYIQLSGHCYSLTYALEDELIEPNQVAAMRKLNAQIKELLVDAVARIMCKDPTRLTWH